MKIESLNIYIYIYIYCNARFPHGRLSALTYETLRMPRCVDVPVFSHMRLVKALARGYIRVIMYLGMYKAALMRRNIYIYI